MGLSLLGGSVREYRDIPPVGDSHVSEFPTLA